MRKRSCLLPLLFIHCFMIANGQQILWLSVEGTSNRELLLNYLQQSPLLGLEEQDYAYKLVQQLRNGIVPGDSLEADRQLTAAAIAFFTDVAYGRKIYRGNFDGIRYTPDCTNIAETLNRSLTGNTFGQLLHQLEPTCREYDAVKKLTALYSARLRDSGYHPVKITDKEVDSTNHPLIEKLFQLGCLDSIDYRISEDRLRTQLRAAQHMFEFLEDGALRPGVIWELNIPLEIRLKELQRSLNTLRWLNCIRQSGKAIVVNIPAAGLFLYQGDSTLMYSRTIVGKERTPTPLLISSVEEVIMYPYWTVPYNIATRELLPAIKGNPKIYLDAGNYQVLDKTGKILDPTTINWLSLSRQNFPYTIRQMNGCDNSLGIIKLNFYNPYSVYLHDTPWKSYFMFNKRYYSHGCIRVEEATKLAKLLLPAEADRIDSLEKAASAPQKGPVVIRLKNKVPLFVLYEVAWPDERGTVRFYDDVYEQIK